MSIRNAHRNFSINYTTFTLLVYENNTDNRLSIAREQCENGAAVELGLSVSYISFVVTVSWIDLGT